MCVALKDEGGVRTRIHMDTPDEPIPLPDGMTITLRVEGDKLMIDTYATDPQIAEMLMVALVNHAIDNDVSMETTKVFLDGVYEDSIEQRREQKSN